MTEYYHSTGQLPDIYYYQLNGKSSQDNYNNQKIKRGRYDKKKSFLENLIINMLRASLETTMKEVIDGIIPTKLQKLLLD